MIGEERQARARILYLSMGVPFDRFFLQGLLGEGFDLHYVYLQEEGKEHCPPAVPRTWLGYHAIRGEGVWRSGRRFAGKLPALLRYLRIARQFGPDLIHTGWFPAVGSWPALTGYRPVSLWVFGSDILIRAKDRAWVRRLGRFTLARSSLILADNEYVLSEVVRLGGAADRSQVFAALVDVTRFRPSLSLRNAVRKRYRWGNQKVILMARHLEPLYRPADAVRAFALLSKRVPGCRLVFCGDGSLRPSLRRLAADLGALDRVDFMGHLAHEEMAGLYNAADVYLKCVESEATGVSMLEAMSCGLPVISADIPSVREWVIEGLNGLLFPVGEVNALADRLRFLLTDSAARKRMGKKGRERARDRMSKIGFPDLARALDRLVSERTGSRHAPG
ncbi:MAG: glycosyltransferase family 4 protein [Nitrospirae bacterium]|nr:glycosyltransferase family 4 protein [Nitrospirota bacterium]